MDFVRYLASKKTVDDRALYEPAWRAFTRALEARSMDILEVGGGIGMMVERLHARGVRARGAYTLLDADAANIGAARARLAGRAGDLAVSCVEGDVLEYLGERPGRDWDAIIAHAVLDLFRLDDIVPLLLSRIRPGGWFYFTVNFDGATIFEPQIDPQFDALIESLYHRTMDERVTQGVPSGDSRAGRHLFHVLRAAGADIVAAGASDWVVHAGAGGYIADEAYFLHCILDFFESSLSGRAGLDATRFAAWLRERRAQIGRAELVYIAHQLDFTGRVPAA